MNDIEVLKSTGERIGELLFFKILTDTDWENFKIRFKTIYPDLIINLRNTYPELTAAEQRLFLLIKLKFSTREISDILGISKESVRKARYRLKRKLNLDKKDNLIQFINSFK